MPHRLLVLVASLLALVCGASCSSYRIEEGGLAFRYLPREDALIVLEFEGGIHTDGGGTEAAKDLQAAASGRRVYPPEGGLIRLDLDKELEPAKPGEEHERADLVELAACVRVLEAHVFEREGKLCFVRVSRIDRFRHVLEIVNAFINREHLRQASSSAPFAPDFPVFDEPTRDMLRSAATNGHAWLSAEAEAIVLDVPMTSANAARCLGWIEQEARRHGDKQPSVFDQVSSLEVAHSRALLRFGQAPHPVVRISFHDDDQPGQDETIRAELKTLGVPIERETVLAKAEDLLVAPPLAPAAPDAKPK